MTQPSPSPTTSETSNWREHQTPTDTYHFELVFEIAAVILSVIVGRALFPDHGGYWMNVYMTGIGVLITVLVLDRRAERRTRLQEERELKAQLVRDAGSTSNEVAKNAVQQMKKRSWLEGDKGLLAGANLCGADWQGLNLRHTNLKKVQLWEANLQGINLQGVDLQQAELWKANLQGANLEATNLYGADLGDANLQGINLGWANLKAADLRNANLQGANLQNADLPGINLNGADLRAANLLGAIIYFDSEHFLAPFDETTILPDGTYWTPDTDMRKFTNPGK